MAAAPGFPILAVPVVLWLASGAALAVLSRRSGARVVLRVAAVFTALWALLATTLGILVFVTGRTGDLGRLLAQPWTALEPSAVGLWVLGALGALIVLTIAFLLNQTVGRGLLVVLEPRPFPWPDRLPVPARRASLWSYHSPTPDAFSFTLLDVEARGVRPRRHDLILLSDGLLHRLAPEEVEAVVAHELGHIQDLDSRYLTFFRTLARMMRWDPVLAYLATSLTSHEEFRADLAAVRLTRRPRALARALFKVITADDGTPAPVPGALGLRGIDGRRGCEEAQRRIERLLELSELPEYAEELVE